MHNRTLADHIQKKSATRFGRIMILTGARQTGKTTLVRNNFKSHAYLSLEDPVTRPQYTSLSAAQWQAAYPSAILDEIQKAPSLFETVKAVYDLYDEPAYLLLGSSQILLLEKVKESLAGRASLAELFPLTLPERMTTAWDDPVSASRLIRWLREGARKVDLFDGVPQADPLFAESEKHFREYLKFGGMPAIAAAVIDDSDKRDWLQDYNRTYLQRDLRDLANLRDLEPFVTAQKSLSSLTAQTLNFSNLARLCGISSKTAKRFISYLELSYQVILLQPWFRNLNKRLVKSPKLHFLDPGVQRALLFREGETAGNEFESAVAAEIYKQIKSHRLNVALYYLRTVDGREVDLLLETEKGYIPIEIKMTHNVSAFDARHLALDGILDKPVIHAFVLSNDPRVTTLRKGVTALPAAWFLSGRGR